MMLRVVLLLGSSTLPVYSQSSSLTPFEPEVRRALPVDGTAVTPPVATPTPVPVMKALPVTPAVITATPTPVATPASTPVAIPTPTSTPFAPYQASDPDGSIRFGPSSGGDSNALAAAQLELAERYYSNKEPESAVPEYEKFLIMTSKSSPGRERALYHLAESQRLMGSTLAAESSFQHLIDENPSGSYKAAAEFRLGELNESTGNLVTAAESFSQAAANAKETSIIQTAQFREALCREQSGDKEKSKALFTTIAKGGETNSYRTQAQLHLAVDSLNGGNKQEALDWYTQVLNSKVTGETYGEAAVKSALILSDLGRNEEAAKLFEKVAASKDSGHWQSVAALASLRIAAQSGDEAGVLKNAGTALSGDDDSKPEVLLLQANAFRKLGKNKQALDLYDTIMRQYPGSKAASLAPFQRLLTLYAARADSLLTEIDQYLLTSSDPSDRARAQLLKAEETLRRGDYKNAALLYHQVDAAALPPSSKPDILYKEAWALTQAGDQAGATASLSRFLTAYPQDERAATALAQRALLKQQNKDFAGALADYSQLDEKYPHAGERELALQQKALLLGQQQDNKGMSDTFSLLLHDYPKSSAASQAHYWIGWVAMENKDYQNAVDELSKARQGDPKQFAERAGLRILLADYYLNHPDEATREAAALNPSLIPPEVSRWLGQKAMESGSPSKAERFLAPLVKDGLPGAGDADIQGMYASSLITQGKYKEAQAPVAICLKLARDPASRAQALLVAASIQSAMKNYQAASSMTDEAMLLQPEGPINAQARIQSGDLLYARQDYIGAAKAYITVAVLSDDPAQAPKALSKAIDSYRRAGNFTEAQKAIIELQKRFPNTPLPPMPKEMQKSS
jgi:TolA-binding protein